MHKKLMLIETHYTFKPDEENEFLGHPRCKNLSVKLASDIYKGKKDQTNNISRYNDDKNLNQLSRKEMTARQTKISVFLANQATWS